MARRDRPADDAPPPEAAAFAPRVLACGDSAVMLELAPALDLDANRRAHRIAEALRAAALPGVTDVVAAIVTVTVHFDATRADAAAGARDAIVQRLGEALAHAGDADAAAEREPVRIPVCYEGEYAPDLAAVAEATGLAPEDVVRRHVASPHRVLMMGFAPGFPYVGGLDAKLAAVPRRATPRARVEAGSVAIANGQTAIYPFATPGGWNVIGRTPLTLFDPAREAASLLAAGDRIAFVPISAAAFARLAERS